MGNTPLFGRPQSRSRQVLKDITIRDFSGGLNVVDNDLNLTTKFSKKLTNLVRSIDGAIEVRQGTRLFADCSAYFDKIINMKYYSGNIIAVGNNGNIVAIDSNGNVKEIWNTTFANTLPGNPDGWSTTVYVSFAVFNGDLIVCNGVNKPLLISAGMTVTYLQDLATKSNVNTPICRYVLTHGRYLCMAGDPNNPLLLYISNVDTSGTWVGDDAPNDAVNIDLGSRVPSGSQAIKGLGRFRDKIVAAFDEALLPSALGVYESGLHNPAFDDAIENVGTVSHRVIQTVGEDMYFCDNVGVNSVKRALFTGNVKPDRASQLIDPAIQSDLNKITSTIVLENDTFSVYDSLASTYMMFIPNASNTMQRTTVSGFAYRKIERLKVDAWYVISNWNYQCATRSALKRVFFARDAEVHIVGNEQDPIERDFMGSEEMFDDAQSFTDYTGWSPVANMADSGIYIPWVWELPWSDNGRRFNIKHSQYINLDTEGNDRFNVQMFVDKIYNDKSFQGETYLDDTLFTDGKGWEKEQLDPALEMEFVGGDYPGLGADEYGSYFGGGRTTADERLYKWPARYKLQKFRFYGNSLKSLKIVSLTLGYIIGNIRRQ